MREGIEKSYLTDYRGFQASGQLSLFWIVHRIPTADLDPVGVDLILSYSTIVIRVGSVNVHHQTSKA